MARQNVSTIIVRQDQIIVGNTTYSVHDENWCQAVYQSHNGAPLAVLVDQDEEIFKVDYTKRTLNIKEFSSWYLQKKSYLKETMALFYTQPLVDKSAVFWSGFKQRPSSVSVVVDKAHTLFSSCSVHSYTINMIFALYDKIKNRLADGVHPLIIVMNSANDLVVSFVYKKKIAYLKKSMDFTLTQVGLTHAINDVMQYLDLTFANEAIKPIFFLDNEWAQNNVHPEFKDALYFYGNDLEALRSKKDDSSVFDTVTCAMYPHQMYGSIFKNRCITLWNRMHTHTETIFGVICLCLAVNAIYLFRQFCRLEHLHGTLTHRIDQSFDALSQCSRDHISFISSDDALALKRIRALSQQKAQKLWHMMHSIRSIAPSIVIEEILIDEKKTLIYVRKQGRNDVSLESIVLPLKKIAHHTSVHHDAHHSVIELTSPFDHTVKDARP